MGFDNALDNRTCFHVNLRDALACQGCGKRPAAKEGYHRGFEYHHVTPRSRGGADHVDNLVLLCHECHLSQHRGTPVTFRVPSRAGAFPCRACAHWLDPRTVAMNCGWYRCDACDVQTHLYDHFYSKSG